jgi:N-methylhydantoinase A
MIRIGIDIGGTFTDFAIWRGDTTGYTSLGTYKAPSTPPQFARAVTEGLEHIVATHGLDRVAPMLVVHGTTVGTNTVIERSGTKLALLTTAGFKDILELARLRLDKPIDMFNQRVTPLVPRERVIEIDERILADGTIDRAIDRGAVVASARAAIAGGAEGIAVCFLHAHRNPAHEIAAGAAIRAALPDVEIVLSHEVWSQQSEYERAIVTLLNAFVKRRMDSYIGEIEAYLSGALPRARLFITRSNGGIMAAREAREFPVHTLLSGPAAGVTASITLGRMLGQDNVLTMDMGGTSTDMSLIRGGAPMISSQAAVGDFPLMMPVTAIEAMGAGGGSIAWMDGPVLKVGPRSAGANPGPACYGRGGSEPTLSDAYLLSGYLGEEGLLGGRLKLSRARAESALAPIAAALGADAMAAAESCIAVATSNMLTKVLPFLARLGVGPADLTLMIFGGAGGIHGPLLAEEVGIRHIVVPRWPSVFCAYGCLVSDLMHDMVRSVQGRRLEARDLAAIFGELRAEADQWLAKQVGPNTVSAIDAAAYADMRYAAQSFTVATDVSAAVAARADLQHYATAFHAEHLRLFGHNEPQAAIAFNELRVRLSGTLPKPGATKLRAAATTRVDAIRRRDMRHGGRWFRAAPIYAREGLPVGWSCSGLALVEQDNATILVPPHFTARVGEYGDIMLSREG